MNKEKVTILLEFVEIRTKLASVFPMLIGFLWTYYYYGELNFLNSLLFFAGAVLFDMATTAINNTVDYYKAVNMDYKHKENIIGKYGLSFNKMVAIIILLILISLVFNISLVFLTDPMLLVIGAIFYLIGITYTFGPLPTSRSPFGEVLSGLTMGFGIFFLAVFMTRFETLLSSQWTLEAVDIHFGWLETLRIFAMSVPLISMISNIMLANNLRDLETDIDNERYTLVYYLGRPKGVQLYQLLSLIPWIAWVLFVISGQFPWWALLGLFATYFHFLSVRQFKQTLPVNSRAAFPEALKSFVLVASTYAIFLIIMIIFR